MFSINLVFVDRQTIRRLNKKYRKIDKATTVLSFCYCIPTEARRAKADGVNEVIGEIFICPVMAKKQDLKLEDLVTHGFKNLLSEIPTTAFN